MRQDTGVLLGSGRASKNGNTRKAGRESYYTPSSEARRLVGLTATLVPAFSKRVGIDPAAGRGAFRDAMLEMGSPLVLAYDLNPLSPEIETADFLSIGLPEDLRSCVAITNPPFGRNSSLSVPFFNHLAPACDYIAFVVPRSWRKWTVQARLDRHFHLIHDEDLRLVYEDGEGRPLQGREGDLKTVFQVWEKREDLRPLVTVPDSGLFEKVSPIQADVALRVFGRGAGTLYEDFDRRPNTTLMFLKITHPRGVEALKEANFAQFYNNVAHVEALSWAEINFAVREYCAKKKISLS